MKCSVQRLYNEGRLIPNAHRKHAPSLVGIVRLTEDRHEEFGRVVPTAALLNIKSGRLEALLPALYDAHVTWLHENVIRIRGFELLQDRTNVGQVWEVTVLGIE